MEESTLGYVGRQTKQKQNLGNLPLLVLIPKSKQPSHFESGYRPKQAQTIRIIRPAINLFVLGC
jgi:hypothetical protein